jgi:hypothetical protein
MTKLKVLVLCFRYSMDNSIVFVVSDMMMLSSFRCLNSTWYFVVERSVLVANSATYLILLATSLPYYCIGNPCLFSFG